MVPPVVAAMLLSGCGGDPGGTRAERPQPGFSESSGSPLSDGRGNWEPLDMDFLQPSAPAWPVAGDGAGDQAEGLATVIRELDAVARLVDRVGRLPAAPGEFRVNFVRIQADLAAVRAGLVEAVLRPHAAPRAYPPLHRDYLE